MTKTLIKNETEYRRFAFEILSKEESDYLNEVLGVLNDTGSCWDYDKDNNPIDEQGKIIPDLTPENMILNDEIKELDFPIIAVHSFEKDSDRTGNFEIRILEFISLKDFEK